MITMSSGITKKLLSERHMRKCGGYIVRRETWWGPGTGTTPTQHLSGYTQEGAYIGRSEFAYRLWHRFGIRPELRTPHSGCCSIGFSERNQKWYGWSHRAICGFAVGDEVKEGDCTNSSGWTDEYLAEHPEADGALPVGFKATSLEDARRMAVAFAEAVS